jgi:quinol monooxygenase YgiN
MQSRAVLASLFSGWCQSNRANPALFNLSRVQLDSPICSVARMTADHDGRPGSSSSSLSSLSSPSVKEPAAVPRVPCLVLAKALYKTDLEDSHCCALRLSLVDQIKQEACSSVEVHISTKESQHGAVLSTNTDLRHDASTLRSRAFCKVVHWDDLQESMKYICGRSSVLHALNFCHLMVDNSMELSRWGKELPRDHPHYAAKVCGVWTRPDDVCVASHPQEDNQEPNPFAEVFEDTEEWISNVWGDEEQAPRAFNNAKRPRLDENSGDEKYRDEPDRQKPRLLEAVEIKKSVDAPSQLKDGIKRPKVATAYVVTMVIEPFIVDLYAEFHALLMETEKTTRQEKGCLMMDIYQGLDNGYGPDSSDSNQCQLLVYGFFDSRESFVFHQQQPYSAWSHSKSLLKIVSPTRKTAVPDDTEWYHFGDFLDHPPINAMPTFDKMWSSKKLPGQRKKK